MHLSDSMPLQNEERGGTLQLGIAKMSELHEADRVDQTSRCSNDEQATGTRPPVSACVSSWSFWCRVSKWPIVFILLNVFLFASFLSYGTVDTGLRRFSHNALVTGIICAGDAILLYLASTFLETQLTLLDEATSKQNTNGLILALASKRVNDFLFVNGQAGRRQPRESVLVGLLYLMTVLSSAASLTSFTYFGFASTSMASEYCSSHAMPRKQLHVLDGIPVDLQTRVQRDHGADDRGMFAHMTDGATYYAANNKPPSMQNDFNDHFTSPTYLLSTQADGSIRPYQQIAEPRMFRHVVGDSDGLETEAFCCVFSKVSHTLTTQIMCLKAFEDVLINGFRNVTLAPIPTGWYLGAESALASKEEYWYARRFSRFPVHEKGETSTQETTEFYKLNPETMEMVLIDSLSVIKEDVQGVLFRPAACRHGLESICCLMIGLVLFPASAWLMHVRRMPVGIAPVCIATFTIAACLNVEWTMALLHLLVLCACVVYYLPWFGPFGREAMVWMIYISLGFVSVGGKLTGQWSPVLFTSSLLVVVLALDHPVFQIIGWIGGIIAVLLSALSLIAGGGSVSFMLITFGIVGSLGLVSLGDTLSRYHIWMQLSTRSLWQRLTLSISNGRNTPDLLYWKLSRKSSYDVERDSKQNFDLTSKLLLSDDE